MPEKKCKICDSATDEEEICDFCWFSLSDSPDFIDLSMEDLDISINEMIDKDCEDDFNKRGV